MNNELYKSISDIENALAKFRQILETPKPSYDRQTVLRGEWIPERGIPYYPIDKGGNTIDKTWGGQMPDGKVVSEWDVQTDTEFHHCHYFPTRELAEEYLLIAEGKWLPKDGDYAWIIYRISGFYEVQNNDRIHGDVEERQLEWFAFFPSPTQRDQYIAKHKPKESVRFERGDFGLGILSRHNAFCVTGQGEKKFDEFISAFEFLSFHCLELGGVVGMKPGNAMLYGIELWDGSNWRSDTEGTWLSCSFFWFKEESQAEKFLATPGVKDALDRFYCIDK